MDDLSHYQVGDAIVARITEQFLTVPPHRLLPQWNEARAGEQAQGLIGQYISADLQSLTVSIHSWLVQIDGLNILIDTACGNGKDRPLFPAFNQLQTPYLERLKKAGVAPEDIDLVLITHLHVDHVGWNTQMHEGRWTPTFPNARYLFSRAEYEFYRDPANVHHAGVGVFEDSVQPIVDAGLVSWIEDSLQNLAPMFQAHETKGHSHDHLSFGLESRGQHALFSGDVMHHPVQVVCPEWNSVFCEFQEDALRSRLWALAYAADRESLFFSSHFSQTSVGTIRRAGNHFEWTAL